MASKEVGFSYHVNMNATVRNIFLKAQIMKTLIISAIYVSKNLDGHTEEMNNASTKWRSGKCELKRGL